jgi:prevent-host-death family protein
VTSPLPGLCTHASVCILMGMREMLLREVRAKLGDLAEAAHHGETIVLTKHGRPYARIAPLEDTMTTQYALCWESAGSESAWVIRMLDSRSDAPANLWDLWVSNPDDLDEDDYRYAKQWAEECFAREGQTVEGWKQDKDGDWIPQFS